MGQVTGKYSGLCEAIIPEYMDPVVIWGELYSWIEQERVLTYVDLGYQEV